MLKMYVTNDLTPLYIKMVTITGKVCEPLYYYIHTHKQTNTHNYTQNQTHTDEKNTHNHTQNQTHTDKIHTQPHTHTYQDMKGPTDGDSDRMLYIGYLLP